MRLGTVLHRVAERSERFRALDRLAAPLARSADEAFRRAHLKSILSGSWLGHPLHPLATDAVIGSWTTAALLDLRRSDAYDEAAQRLVAIGVAAAIPTAASGVSDWADTPDPRARRMGVVHALSNVMALALNSASYVARRSGRHALGARLTAVSALPLTIGGFLGAHMTYARGVGVSRTAFDEQIADWTPLDARTPVHEGWGGARVDGLSVLTRLREGQVVQVVAARCTRCGAALRADESGSCLRCPEDSSVFRGDDGGVLDGPAATPLPVYEARRAPAGGLEVRSPGSAA